MLVGRNALPTITDRKPFCLLSHYLWLAPLHSYTKTRSWTVLLHTFTVAATVTTWQGQNTNGSCRCTHVPHTAAELMFSVLLALAFSPSAFHKALNKIAVAAYYELRKSAATAPKDCGWSLIRTALGFRLEQILRITADTSDALMEQLNRTFLMQENYQLLVEQLCLGVSCKDHSGKHNSTPIVSVASSQIGTAQSESTFDFGPPAVTIPVENNCSVDQNSMLQRFADYFFQHSEDELLCNTYRKLVDSYRMGHLQAMNDEHFRYEDWPDVLTTANLWRLQLRDFFFGEEAQEVSSRALKDSFEAVNYEL